MKISTNSSRVKIARAYVPEQALAKALEFDDKAMRVLFTDGRVLSVPLKWFPRLWRATAAQRRQY